MLKRSCSQHKSQEYDDQSLTQALWAVAHGMSQREASRCWNVPRGTLQGRIRGRQDWKLAHQEEQLLTPAQEAEIVAWCCKMEQRFLPVHLSHLRDYALAILQNQAGPDEDVMVGEHWVDRFRDRHPELRVVMSENIDEKRVMAKNPTNIMDFYVKLSNIFEKLEIPIPNRFNCDEKGWQLGITGHEKVVIVLRHDMEGARNRHAGSSKQPGSRETITTIDCICADGTVLPPFIIMKGKYILTRWSHNSPLPPSTRWACSPNGWTDNVLGVEFIRAFDEWTAEKSADGKWRCLILDGHGSHLTFEFLMYAIKARIVVVGLPSHTTDFLQPLDVGLFRPLQRSYRQEVDRRMRKGQLVTKDLFATVLDKARNETYTEKNIKSAFEATGITPINPWRTTEMKAYRARLQAKTSTPSSEPNPAAKRQDALAKYHGLSSNPNATIEELRGALTEAITLIEGSEARAALLGLELASAREAIRDRQKRMIRGGRVGQARVYTQAEIEAEEEKKREVVEARAREKQEKASRGRGRGRGRARGRPRGRGQGRGRISSEAEDTDSNSDLGDPFLRSSAPSESDSE